MNKYEDKIISLLKVLIFLAFTFLVVGVVISEFFFTLDIEKFTAGATASQIAMVIYGLMLIGFNLTIIKKLLKGKLNKESIWKALKLTLGVFLANFLIASLLVKSTIVSDTTTNAITSGTLMGMFILPVIIAPFVEELVFRAGIKYALVDKGGWKPIYYIIISSVLFGALHWQPGRFGLFTVGVTGLMGILYSRNYVKNDNILIPIMSHMFYNGFTVLVAIFLVPLVEHLI